MDELWGDPAQDYGLATLEGGDVMPVGDGLVLVGMGERTSPQGVGLLAEALFDQGRATRVLACQMPKDRAAMHLDTVFTFCGGEVVTSFTDVAAEMAVYDLHPGEGRAPLDIRRIDRPLFDVLAKAMGFKTLTVVPTGGEEPGRGGARAGERRENNLLGRSGPAFVTWAKPPNDDNQRPRDAPKEFEVAWGPPEARSLRAAAARGRGN